MTHNFIGDLILHKPKILSYAIGLPYYTLEEQNKCINNIAKIICQTGLTYINDSDSQIDKNIYGFISLQEIKQLEWEILKNEINKLEPLFLEKYDIFITDNNNTSIVTLINKASYQIKLKFINESLLNDKSLPYHFFILNDASNYSVINKVIYINLELPKNKHEQIIAINTLKQKFNSLDKKLYGSYRIIITGQFNNENPELLQGFDKMIDDFDKSKLIKFSDKIVTSNSSYVFDNYNKILSYSTLTDFTDFKSDKILLSKHLPLFVKLDIINVIDYDFSKVESKYSKLINVDFVISHINNLEVFIKEFKQELEKFKLEYNHLTPDITIKINQIEKTIEQNLINQKKLQLFNDIYVFNNPIKEYNPSVFGTTLTDIEVFGSKTSASDSLILRAKYNGNPVFIKMFSLDNAPFMKDNHGLVYEQRIYKYLMERNNNLKPYYESYFVKVYDVFKIKYINFFEQMESLGIKIKGGPSNGKIYFSRYRQNSQNTIFPSIFSGKDKMVYFTVTEDIQGDNLNNFLSNNLGYENIVIEVLFDVLYGIYLLNTRLGIIHGDNHFGNILIKPETNIKEYIINKTSLTRESKYRICLYDFDMSYLFDYKNNALDDSFNKNIGRINKYNTAKDIWTVINNIGLLLQYNPTTINSSWKHWYDNMQNNFFGRIINSEPYVQTYIYDLINNVFLQTKEQKDTLVENFQAHIKNGKYWNSFCISTTSPDCIQPFFPELEPELVIKRYMYFYKNKLNFINANAYYKKYLKYKNKYLELKSKLQK